MVTTRFQSAWVGIARDDAREWWRENKGATFAEFAEWALEQEGRLLRGAGISGRKRLTALQHEIIDDIQRGLTEAWQAEIARRRARRAA